MITAFPGSQLLAVALGSAIGGVMRWQVQLWLNPRWSGFPLGTVLVNWLGGLLIGMALAWFERTPNELWRLLLITGCLGGLTTFSSFSGESLLLLRGGAWGLALTHTALHVIGSLTFAAIGFRLLRALLRALLD